MLRRQEDEAIVIRHAGEELVIFITDINPSGSSGKPTTGVGFHGPKSFDINREEVLKAKEGWVFPGQSTKRSHPHKRSHSAAPGSN